MNWILPAGIPLYVFGMGLLNRKFRDWDDLGYCPYPFIFIWPAVLAVYAAMLIITPVFRLGESLSKRMAERGQDRVPKARLIR